MTSRVEPWTCLVNNAGATGGAPVAEFDETALEKELALNVKGVFHPIRLLIPLLPAAGTEPARIINIGSIDGLSVSLFETYAYSSSKAACTISPPTWPSAWPRPSRATPSRGRSSQR
jgi:NAD(P)-dependent dehydrogenase (short-subunit alcohol dehydrogenase family)